MVEKKKNENGDEEFVGWKSPDGKLEVVGQKYVESIQFTIDAGTFSNPKVSPTWAAVKGSIKL